MIVPAGNNKLDWSPKETKLQKVASDGQVASDIEVDALYEAAKGVVEASKDEDCKDCKDCKCDPCECEDKKGKDGKQEKEACGEMQDEAIVLDVEEVSEAPCEECPSDGGGFGDMGGLGDVLEVSDEVEEEGAAQSVSEAVAEVEQKAEEAEAVVQEVSDAVEQIEEAVQAVKEVCGAGEDVADAIEEEVEVEIVDDDSDDSGDKDIPGEDDTGDEVIVEGEEPAMDKSASAEEFCKYAKLSPQNRKKLNNYWTNLLGYPKDFVNLMTKDYEG